MLNESDYKFYARAYRVEGRALTSSEIAPILADVATFSCAEIWAVFEKFGLLVARQAPKARLVEALGECLRVAPVFGADGKTIIAPRLYYNRELKAFRVSRVPVVQVDEARLGSAKAKKRKRRPGRPRIEEIIGDEDAQT